MTVKKSGVIRKNDLLMFKYLWVLAIVSKEIQFVVLGAILVLLLINNRGLIFRFNKLSAFFLLLIRFICYQ